jgi:hypothetical protein
MKHMFTQYIIAQPCLCAKTERSKSCASALATAPPRVMRLGVHHGPDKRWVRCFSSIGHGFFWNSAVSHRKSLSQQTFNVVWMRGCLATWYVLGLPCQRKIHPHLQKAVSGCSIRHPMATPFLTFACSCVHTAAFPRSTSKNQHRAKYGVNLQQ